MLKHVGTQQWVQMDLDDDDNRDTKPYWNHHLKGKIATDEEIFFMEDSV